MSDAEIKSDLELKVSTGASAAEPQARELKPEELVEGRYRVVKLIGHGAMGTVYCVEQIFLKQMFALKTLNPITASDKSARRFQIEAQAASRLDHPNLVRSTDFGLIDGSQPFFVMDLVTGETLEQFLKRNGTLPWEMALKLFIPLCFAIEYAHRQGVIHRDLKPGNIVLVPDKSGSLDQVPKIVDFGIAKTMADETGQALTKTGEVFGTPLYMSPEQCSGHVVDNRSDIYSLGCVLYEALTGAPPFRGLTSFDTIMKHINEALPSLKAASLGKEFPDALERVVAKMLAKDPKARYSHCADVARDLVFLQQGKVERIAKGVSSVLSKRPSKSGLLVGCATAICLIASGAVLVQLMPRDNGMPSSAVPGVKKGDKFLLAREPEKESADDGLDKMLTDEAEGQWIPVMPEQDKERPGYRRFNFGKIYLGRLRVLGRSTEKDQPDLDAKGSVVLPDHGEIQLKVYWTALRSYPALLGRFNEVGLTHLRLEYPDTAEHYPADSPSGTREPQWLGADTTFNHQMEDDALFFGRRLKTLLSLGLKGSGSIEGLRNMQIDDLPKLVDLELTNTRIGGKDLAQLKVLERLNILFISGMRDSGNVLKALRHSRNLYGLSTVNSGITDADLENCAEMPGLGQLNLEGNHGVTNKGIAILANSKTIRGLCLLGCSVTPAATADLLRLHLKSLEPPATWTEMQTDVLRKQGITIVHRRKSSDQA